MAKNEEQINKLREHIRKTKAENYPIEGHLLEKEPDYNKNFYFKVLCMILQYSDSIAEEQTMFLQRLIKGCHAENSLQDYMRQALELSVEDYKEFAEKVLQGDLKYIFELDMLLVSHLGECSEEYNQFLAEVTESIGINIEELSFISKMCVGILEQDWKKYLDAEADALLMLKDIRASRYMLNNKKTEEYIDENNLLLFSPKLETIDLCDYIKDDYINKDKGFIFSAEQIFSEETIFSKETTICLYNKEINLKSYPLIIYYSSNVKLIKCKIIGGENTIRFQSCGDIQIINCEFYDFSVRTLEIENCEKISIILSKFENCIGKCDSSWNCKTNAGAVIGGAKEKLKLIYCEFNNCGGSYFGTATLRSLISNCNTSIRYCKFIRCGRHDSNRKKLLDGYNVNLFSFIIESHDNEVIDSHILS